MTHDNDVVSCSGTLQFLCSGTSLCNILQQLLNMRFHSKLGLMLSDRLMQQTMSIAESLHMTGVQHVDSSAPMDSHFDRICDTTSLLTATCHMFL
jgi:hypothetical protein